ncbi:DgyrCDS7087 [Dimorphilus gyrociliatus]|uniref:DgyrCDS7087 n=1 Tax=Dimorphilus gyrociliatus TaxID=2664684 RepID=A0A7I8VQ61_9ANNE|nr:DgyrCDS7087 [Dimorphilus gyrociliatus]
MVASTLTLLLISCDRFFGIVFAIRARMTARRARYSLGFVWLAASTVATPLIFYQKYRENKWKDYTEKYCSGDWPSVTVQEGNNTIIYFPCRTAYFTIVSGALFFAPLAIMAPAYGAISCKLCKASQPGERVSADLNNQRKKTRKVITMLVVLIVVFAVCWGPLQLPDWFHTLQFWSKIGAFLNSALNPLIYAGFNNNFKIGFYALFSTGKSNYGYTTAKFRRESSEVTATTKLAPGHSQAYPLTLLNKNKKDKLLL